MKSRPCLGAWLVFGLAIAAGPGVARADVMAALRKTVVTADIPLAGPVSTPLRDQFGLGAMPSVSAAAPIKPWLLVGLRLRCGILSNGPAPSDPTLKDPGSGGLGAFLVNARVRPWGKDDHGLAAGPWVEVGVGPGLTGRLVRLAAEAGLGWNFRSESFTFGPTARYLQVVETSNAIDTTDAKIVLLGLEVAIRDPQTPREVKEAPPPIAESATAHDRDGDGIPDDVDKCPDDPEDKDGFEDEDGCPDPDNDKDGIADAKDACPNEPETVNGVQDDDGCPDEGPLVIQKDRIYLKERLLFDTNRARVRAEGQPALGAVLNLWKRHPEWDHLIVDGHADRHGSDKYNLWLSHVRAERVRSKLIEMGFPEEKLTLRAFGRRKPRVPEETVEADRENRRVEFVIVKKNGSPTQTAGESAPTENAAAVAPDEAAAPTAPQTAERTTPVSPQEPSALEPPAQASAPLEPPPQRSPNEDEGAP
jgi:outer membrane protein OmpA-like peptidoglycan-associated protein